MVLKPFYSYAEVARLEGKSVSTLRAWVSADRRLPFDERRFPNAHQGQIPLADLRRRWGMSNETIASLDLDELEKRARRQDPAA